MAIEEINAADEAQSSHDSGNSVHSTQSDRVNEFSDHLTSIQLMISESRICFEENVEKAKKNVLQTSEEMTKWIKYNEKLAIEGIENMAAQRRTKFEEFQTVLASNVLPGLLKLAQEVKNLETIGLMPEDKMADLKALSDLVSNYFTISDREAIQNIGIVFYEDYRSLMATPHDKTFGITTALSENHIYAVADPKPAPGRMEINLALNNTPFLAPILYSEIIITMENAKDGTSLNNGRFSLQSLKDHGHVTVGTGMIGFWVDLDYLPEYVKVFITVHGKNVMNSPMEIHIKKREEFFHDISIIPNNVNGGSEEENHFHEISMGENVTRTGKSNKDLDESDARAMGLPGHVTVSEVPTIVDISTSKRPVHTGKNLSFHYHSVVHDGSMSEPVPTKTEDGEMKIHKSLLQQQSQEPSNGDSIEIASFHESYLAVTPIEDPIEPTIWNLSNGTVQNIKDDFKKLDAEKRRENELNAIVRSETIWELDSPNLVLEQYNLVHQSELSLEPEALLPQSLAVDPILDRVYVSDVYSGFVFMFEKLEPKGTWPPNHRFDIPRSVLTMPDSRIENGSGHDVLVMDEQSIKHFNSDGILHKEYLKIYAKNCRGLDLWRDNYLVTSELTRHNLKLAMVNLKTGQLERKIFITEGLQMNPIQLSRAKCMFIKATIDHIYITDLGNGWILDIDMKRGGSRKLMPFNTLPMTDLMGVETDAFGNVFAVSSHDDLNESSGKGHKCNLEVFSPNGDHIRTIIIEGRKPSSIKLQDSTLYMADVVRRKIEIFNIVDKNL